MLGDKIKFLRNEKKLTQAQLAEKCGISKNALWNYENNKRNPNIEILTNIANDLGVSLDKLLGDSDTNDKSYGNPRTLGGYMKAIEVLLNLLISIINTLNKDGFKIYDDENRDYFIDTISYCKVDDRLIVSFKEDK